VPGKENTNNLYTFYNMIDVTKTSASIFGIIQSYNFDEYTDCYIPSLEELKILYQNRDAIGNFDSAGEYWSSNDQNAGLDTSGNQKLPVRAYSFNFATGESVIRLKNLTLKFRAIRYF
jgi:hypothetical protein